MTALEHDAATQAIEETRRWWLPILEAVPTEDLDIHARLYLTAEIRRLRRALKLPPPPPSAADRQWRREQTRDRVRRYRARQKTST